MTTFDTLCTKRVSYIVATIGRPQHLLLVLHNLADLKGPGDEVLVIDASDNDKTAELIAQWSSLVDVYVHEADRGAAIGYNKGILLAKGKYLRLCADDDIIYPKAMSEALAIMDARPEIDFLFCRTRKHLLPGPPMVTKRLKADYGRRATNAVMHTACGMGWLLRRRTYAIAGLLNPTLMPGDVEFMARCIDRRVNVVTSDIILGYHPIWPHSLTNLNSRAWHEDFVTLCRAYKLPAYLTEEDGEFTVRFTPAGHMVKLEEMLPTLTEQEVRVMTQRAMSRSDEEIAGVLNMTAARVQETIVDVTGQIEAWIEDNADDGFPAL